jgi:hypothetical protein
MVLLKAERAQAALTSANEALEHAEAICARLNSSSHLLRLKRDELAAKMRNDTAAALTHLGADQTTVVAQPARPVRVWSF